RKPAAQVIDLQDAFATGPVRIRGQEDGHRTNFARREVALDGGQPLKTFRFRAKLAGGAIGRLNLQAQDDQGEKDNHGYRPNQQGTSRDPVADPIPKTELFAVGSAERFDLDSAALERF